MKAFRLNGMAIIAILFSISFTSCGDDYDDSIIIDRVDNLENRVTQLEEICKQINTNISSLQNIVAALENNDYVTSVTPITKDGKEVGYTITFSKSFIWTGSSPENGSSKIVIFSSCIIAQALFSRCIVPFESSDGE